MRIIALITLLLVVSTIVADSTNNFSVGALFAYNKWRYTNKQEQYPYLAADSKCKVTQPTSDGFKVQSFYFIDKTADALKSTVSRIPVSVLVDASTWGAYSSGVYNGCGNTQAYNLNHAVVAIGYDEQGNWIIRNSWSTSWGMDGHMKLAPGNTCGILLSPLIAVRNNRKDDSTYFQGYQKVFRCLHSEGQNIANPGIKISPTALLQNNDILSYCYNDHIENALEKNCSQKKLIFNKQKKFFITQKQVIAALKPFKPENVEMTFPVEFFDCDGCQIHIGFRDHAQSIQDHINLCVKNILVQNVLSKVIITSHLQGGAIATLVSIELLKQLKANGQIIIYTFGAPKIGNQNFVEYLNKLIPNSYRVVNYYDSVPHLSFKQILDFKHHGYEIWMSNPNSLNQFKVCYNYDLESQGCSAQVSLLDFLIKDYFSYFGINFFRMQQRFVLKRILRALK
ncbi:hypothetical protein ABPG72_004213 [Tetrahymena utriculariae]